jgi:hypothetical protein
MGIAGLTLQSGLNIVQTKLNPIPTRKRSFLPYRSANLPAKSIPLNRISIDIKLDKYPVLTSH